MTELFFGLLRGGLMTELFFSGLLRFARNDALPLLSASLRAKRSNLENPRHPNISAVLNNTSAFKRTFETVCKKTPK